MKERTTIALEKKHLDDLQICKKLMICGSWADFWDSIMPVIKMRSLVSVRELIRQLDEDKVIAGKSKDELLNDIQTQLMTIFEGDLWLSPFAKTPE